MSAPSHVQVGPIRYDIVTTDEGWVESGLDADEHYGYTDHQRSHILLNRGSGSQMLPVILMHEVMHAVAFVAGQLDDRKRDEEAWVIMVSPLLLDTLRRNPDVATYLLTDPHAGPGREED